MQPIAAIGTLLHGGLAFNAVCSYIPLSESKVAKGRWP